MGKGFVKADDFDRVARAYNRGLVCGEDPREVYSGAPCGAEGLKAFVHFHTKEVPNVEHSSPCVLLAGMTSLSFWSMSNSCW